MHASLQVYGAHFNGCMHLWYIYVCLHQTVMGCIHVLLFKVFQTSLLNHTSFQSVDFHRDPLYLQICPLFYSGKRETHSPTRLLDPSKI